MTNLLARARIGSTLLFLCCCGSVSAAHRSHAAATGEAHKAPGHTSQRGKASVYSHKLAHQPMADGTPLDLNSNSAASKTLPLGSKAKVTNLRNGRSAVVVIRDRGPFVKGRIIDLTPHTAAELHFKSRGLVMVEVTPIVPEPKSVVVENRKGHVEPIQMSTMREPNQSGVIDLLICARQSARIYQLLSLCR